MKTSIHQIKKFFKRIKRLLKWIPIIWSSEDYDYRFGIDVFAEKLKELRDYLNSDKALTLNAKYHAEKLNTILKLIDLVYEQEYYGMLYMAKLEELYGPRKFVTKPTNDSKVFELTIEYERNYTESELQEIDNHERKLMLESKYMQEKAHRLLWKMVEFYIRSCWD